MRTLARLLILLALCLTGCEAIRNQVVGRPQVDDPSGRRPAVDAFLHGRPSLGEERAADQPRADAYRRKRSWFGDYGNPGWWAP